MLPTKAGTTRNCPLVFICKRTTKAVVPVPVAELPDLLVPPLVAHRDVDLAPEAVLEQSLDRPEQVALMAVGEDVQQGHRLP